MTWTARITPAAALLALGAVAMAGQPVKDYDEPPRLKKQSRPRYPNAAFAKRVEGTVEVEFVIDEEGKVSGTKVVKSVAGLDEAAVECVQQWTFRPARKEGRPVRTTAIAPITFRITAKKADRPAP